MQTHNAHHDAKLVSGTLSLLLLVLKNHVSGGPIILGASCCLNTHVTSELIKMLHVETATHSISNTAHKSIKHGNVTCELAPKIIQRWRNMKPQSTESQESRRYAFAHVQNLLKRVFLHAKTCNTFLKQLIPECFCERLFPKNCC